MSSAIELELQKATKTNPRKKEPRQKYLARLIEAVQELKDNEWEELSNEAQVWVNEGAEAIKKNADDPEIEDFPDLEDAEEEADEAPAGDEEETEKAEEEADEEAPPKKKKKAVVKDDKPAKAAKPEKAEKEKPEKRSGPKPTGIKVQIKKMVLKKPAISVDEIMERLSKDGTVKPSKLTISAIRSEFRHSLFVLRDAGVLADSIKLD